MTHMTLLESSDIVDFQALPTAPPPTSATPSAAATGQVLSANRVAQTSGTNMPLVLMALAGGLVAGVFATKRLAGGGRRRPRRW
jgi:hypothetical protein